MYKIKNGTVETLRNEFPGLEIIKPKNRNYQEIRIREAM
jgi:hypothetical protein